MCTSSTEDDMTKTQIKKLDAVISRLEALEHSGEMDRIDKDELRAVRTALFRVRSRNP